jgi:hypothetical protein
MHARGFAQGDGLAAAAALSARSGTRSAMAISLPYRLARASFARVVLFEKAAEALPLKAPWRSA